MPENERYSLVCVSNPNGQKKLVINKVMINKETNYGLMDIDKYMLDDFDYKALPLHHRLYIFDNESKIVTPVIPKTLDPLAKESIKSFIGDKDKRIDVRKDQMWRNSFESVLINDLNKKSSFMHVFQNESAMNFAYCNNGQPAYFYGRPDVKVLNQFPYLPKQDSKLDHSHYEYNPNDNKYHIKDYMENIKDVKKYVKSMDDYVEDLATWYGNYRNFRNYYIFRSGIRVTDNTFDVDVRKDIDVINKHFQNNQKIGTINIDQLNVFDVAEGKDMENKEFQVITSSAKGVMHVKNGHITHKRAEELNKDNNSDSDAYDDIDENMQPKIKRSSTGEPIKEDYESPKTIDDVNPVLNGYAVDLNQESEEDYQERMLNDPSTYEGAVELPKADTDGFNRSKAMEIVKKQDPNVYDDDNKHEHMDAELEDQKDMELQAKHDLVKNDPDGISLKVAELTNEETRNNPDLVNLEYVKTIHR